MEKKDGREGAEKEAQEREQNNNKARYQKRHNSFVLSALYNGKSTRTHTATSKPRPKKQNTKKKKNPHEIRQVQV